jgi:hypothetical protein
MRETPWLYGSLAIAVMGWSAQYMNDLRQAARATAVHIRAHAVPSVFVGLGVTTVGIVVLFRAYDHSTEVVGAPYRYRSILVQHLMAQTREGYFRGLMVAVVAALLIAPVSGSIATVATDTFNTSRGSSGGAQDELAHPVARRKKFRPCASETACDVIFVLVVLLGYLSAG